ncbi:MAG TPA: hypothetical protein VNT79_06360 [Phycisphaerae bacterium]|nr:hypothetical protein [Phycisphaerae bacterium]
MTDHSKPPPPQNERESRTAVWLRGVGTIVLLLLVFTGAIEVFTRTGWIEPPISAFLTDFNRFALYIVAGLGLGGLLVGIAALLRVLRDLHNSFTRMERFQYERVDATAAAADTERSARHATPAKSEAIESEAAARAANWKEIASLLADIRDNALLSEDDRNRKRVRVANEEIAAAADRVQVLMGEGDYAQARELAAQIDRRHPNDARAATLIAQVEKSRESHESEDVRNTTREVEDLMSISAWGRARELAQNLQQRHPDSPDARQLLLRIERDHRVFDDEQKRRMSAEVQRFVSRKRWEEALAVARTFIERFPGSEESESLRMQMPTLETNAEIELRQRLESQFMDLVRHGRYLEALDLARRVIDQFPDSPQSEVLRSQLERLEELAENPEATPARVRID